jgi:hypothetical protein
VHAVQLNFLSSKISIVLNAEPLSSVVLISRFSCKPEVVMPQLIP